MMKDLSRVAYGFKSNENLAPRVSIEQVSPIKTLVEKQAGILLGNKSKKMKPEEYLNFQKVGNITICMGIKEEFKFEELDVIVPSKFEGLPVNMIANHAFYDSSIKSISLPDSLHQISESAFACCRNLKYVDIPNNVRVIQSLVFYRCQDLVSVTLPGDLYHYRTNIFEGCTSLKTVSNVNKDNKDLVAYLKERNIMVHFSTD